MKVGEELRYYNSLCGNRDNKKYWDMFQHITAAGVCTGGRWAGDYYVRIFVCEDGTYEIWENTEYGIAHSIKRIA